MEEALTFVDYRIDEDALLDIYSIGAERGTPGVIPEMATAFGHELSIIPTVDNLGQLIHSVGPNKELQKNIEHVKDVLGPDALKITRDWAKRSELLRPVMRSFVSEETTDQDPKLAVITGGMRNWMARRAMRFVRLRQQRNHINDILLVGGNRVMSTSEGPDVEDGMTEVEYLRLIVGSHLTMLGVTTSVVEADSGIGDEVMNAGAQRIQSMVDPEDKIAVVSNAGTWVQNVGQMRRALRNVFGNRYDNKGQQVLAVSDSFTLGTGEEPTNTHQNPFSAAGIIVRNAQELVRHYQI